MERIISDQGSLSCQLCQSDGGQNRSIFDGGNKLVYKRKNADLGCLWCHNSKHSRCQGIPSALAASLCPGSIAWIPERTISAMYAPVFKDMESTPAVIALKVMPRFWQTEIDQKCLHHQRGSSPDPDVHLCQSGYHFLCGCPSSTQAQHPESYQK